MAKEKAKKVWELLSKISFELDQIKKGYKDIEVLREWMKDMDISITFQCWRMERRRTLSGGFVQLRL